MGNRNKLLKFNDITTFENVYECYDYRVPILVQNDIVKEMKGNWNRTHFVNENPLVLELACGRGEYTNVLALADPNNNYLGVDVKGARIWKGAKIALEKNIKNAAYIRARIEKIDCFLSANEVDEIWITFPDPFLKVGKENRRLTSPEFLTLYRNILKPGGWVHLKTDDITLYDYTLEIIQNDPKCYLDYTENDIYSKPLVTPELEIKTFYEKMHLADNRKIKYIKFKIN
jgi:tRNA (guanine-N7-)-methyltransferase